jgi:hypothetical protein
MVCPGQSKNSIRYQIHIRGKLVLEGAVADQSALYGILAKLHDLGLTLIRVERL